MEGRNLDQVEAVLAEEGSPVKREVATGSELCESDEDVVKGGEGRRGMKKRILGTQEEEVDVEMYEMSKRLYVFEESSLEFCRALYKLVCTAESPYTPIDDSERLENVALGCLYFECLSTKDHPVKNMSSLVYYMKGYFVDEDGFPLKIDRDRRRAINGIAWQVSKIVKAYAE